MDKVILYNTMTRKKEDFKPINPNLVTIYTCGPTVYNYAHIGNLRTFIFEDILKKTLNLAGYKVKHVMNITDVGHLTGDGDDGEDKVGKEANKEHKTIEEIIQFYTNAFLQDIDKLNIKRADVLPRASEHIAEMLEIIKMLENNGHTYKANGNVYFSIDTCKDYGKLARLRLDDLIKGKRVSVDSSKKNANDFVLWFTKSKFENQAMKWDSEYGTGYPGWHLECSAMSRKYLGDTFDIHAGGVDAIPVHHTNEIAQSECATGKTMAHYWMHGEFLLSEKGKMSKSTGDFKTLTSLEKAGISPLAYRYFCLMSHYRKQLQFTTDSVQSANTSLNTLYKKIDELKQDVKESNVVSSTELSEDAKKYINDIKQALYNDLNTSVALSKIHLLLREKDITADDKLAVLNLADSVLSLDLIKERKAEPQAQNADIPLEVKELAIERVTAKAAKDWAKCDELRAKINALGYTIKDSKTGYELIKN